MSQTVHQKPYVLGKVEVHGRRRKGEWGDPNPHDYRERQGSGTNDVVGIPKRCETWVKTFIREIIRLELNVPNKHYYIKNEPRRIHYYAFICLVSNSVKLLLLYNLSCTLSHYTIASLPYRSLRRTPSLQTYDSSFHTPSLDLSTIKSHLFVDHMLKIPRI